MARRTKSIALLLDLTDCYDLDIVKGVLRFARQRPDWRVSYPGWQLDPQHDPQTIPCDGVITRIYDLHPYRRNTPPGAMVVDVAGTEAKAKYAQVTNNDDWSGYLAGKHLVRRGLRHLAFLGVKGDGWSENRRRGAERAAAESSLPAVRKLEIKDRWLWNEEKYASLETWLKRLPKPCGLVITDDAMAVKAMWMINAAKIAVPDALSIMVVGNADEFFALAEPALSAVCCDCQRIGYEAARRLQYMFNSGDRAPPPLRIHPRPITLRESTSRVMIADPKLATALECIHTRAPRDKTLYPGSVAKLVGAPLRKLEADFKAEFGQTMREEILWMRLDKARKRLEAGLAPAAAAKRSGFPDGETFEREFAKYYGFAPVEYLKSRYDPMEK